MEALEHHGEATIMADAEHAPSPPLPHDSMVTVRLSEPPSLTVNTQAEPAMVLPEQDSSPCTPIKEIDDGEDLDQTPPSRKSRPAAVGEDEIDLVSRMSEIPSPVDSDERRGSDSSTDSKSNEVNWEELQKTEDEQPRDQDSEDSTALLLARLEQENNLLVTNPKSGLTPVTAHSRNRSASRPPSIQYLKRLVNGPTPPALRYSLLPAPPMTDLEFYAALVQDYKQTAQRLPTLLSKKIRSGVPPPLRGVVWQSMSGARDSLLEDQFDKLCGESSPYDGIIGKDIGRSFPGVEMFRDPDGDGQRMLGRVLKCFSLYDHKIGYCQGLGFLVGPLLMHMGDKQAFCVLVRLMEHYDLRNCFLPDLSGLHVRIYQFKELLKRHLPTLSSHLDVLQIEPAYVSQWFLSFFAVTCPLPMLFRIYDVLFAEGASETIMRVALSVMRKNEEKILACTEFEDVMQLLLSRGLWDVYHYNADEFVNDFVSLTGIVTNESLQGLEVKYRESKSSDTTTSPSSDVGSAATRFLGRLWLGSNSSTKSTNLSPGLAAPSRPVSFLRRSNSKQSIASTMNSADGGSDSMMSSASTEATTISRDSGNTDSSSVRAQSVAINVPRSTGNKDRNLHGQIEDLLMALSEMQRDHAILATQLEREREEREEDRQAITSLLDGLRRKPSIETIKMPGSEESLETVTAAKRESAEIQEEDEQESDRVDELSSENESDNEDKDDDEVTQADLSQLLDIVEERFAKRPDRRRSSTMQSKSQMRDDLVRVREQLIGEVSKSQDLSRRLVESEQEVLTLKDQVRDGHSHIRNAHQEKQRLEKQIHDLRARQSRERSPEKAVQAESEWPKRTSGNPGLRELKLGRSGSTRSQAPAFAKRTSSLITTSLVKENEVLGSSVEASPVHSTADNDALILELVQAKTAEAIAKQEAEEAKAKLESLRKMLGLSTPEGAGHRPSPSQPNLASTSTSPFSPYLERANTTMGSFSPYLSRAAAADTKAASPPATTPAAGGSFWGGWGKRAVSVTTEKVASSDSA